MGAFCTTLDDAEFPGTTREAPRTSFSGSPTTTPTATPSIQANEQLNDKITVSPENHIRTDTPEEFKTAILTTESGKTNYTELAAQKSKLETTQIKHTDNVRDADVVLAAVANSLTSVPISTTTTTTSTTPDSIATSNISPTFKINSNITTESTLLSSQHEAKIKDDVNGGNTNTSSEGLALLNTICGSTEGAKALLIKRIIVDQLKDKRPTIDAETYFFELVDTFIQTNQLPAELASIATETNDVEESVLLCIRHYAEAELLIRKKTNALMMMVEKDVTDTASSTSNPPLGHTKYTWDAPPVLGRIDVRENKEGIREFYNIKTNEKFNPIGFNYISVGNRVPGIQKHAGSHTLFDVNGINGWEQHRAHAKKHLPIIASKGYRVVRVFLNYAATGNGGLNALEKAENPSIDTPYFDNLIEFIGIAKEAGLRVHITIEPFPSSYLPSSYSSYSALCKVANKCDRFIQRDLVQAQAKYVEDVLEYVVTKETRDAIFSIEPIQEFGLRTIVKSQKNAITYVKPWGEKEFGPWPEKAKGTNLKPRTYSLGNQGKDWFQFYKDVSYYYPEQLLKAVRKVDKTLLYTVSVSGLDQANLKTIGFDQRAWHHWAYLPSLAKLGASDMRVYGDLHIYNHNVDEERTASEYPEQIGIGIDRVLASYGLIKNVHKEDHYTKTSHWRSENIKIPLVIGEWGARLPRHNKPSGKLLTPTIAEAKLMVTEFTSHLEKRGISGWYYWMYDNSFCVNPKGMPASFYTPVEFPELLAETIPLGHTSYSCGTLPGASATTTTTTTHREQSATLKSTATTTTTNREQPTILISSLLPSSLTTTNSSKNSSSVNQNQSKPHHGKPHHRQPSALVQDFIGLHSHGSTKRKRHLRRRSILVVGSSSTFASINEDQLSENLDFEISWAMFNYYASLGDPTRANGVNRTQWRTFCKASRLSEHLTTAKVDLLFTAALKINDEESGSVAGKEFAAKTSSSSLSSPSDSSELTSRPRNSSRTITSRSKSELTFVQFFYGLHQASKQVESPTLFIENYLFPLATILMDKLVSVSATRRASVKHLLSQDNKHSTVKRILKPNRKALSKLYAFYISKQQKQFDFASLLAFAKDFAIVPTLISHSILQKLMHDVKMNDKHQEEENEKTEQHNNSSQLSLLEFEELLCSIAQFHRHLSTKNENNNSAITSYSTYLDEDLIALLKHLEFGEGRRKMASRGQRESRISRFSSSEHFKIPEDINYDKPTKQYSTE